MADLTPLEQVQLDAQRITLERIEAEKKAISWQREQEGTVSLDESVEAATEVKTPVKAVKKTKGQK